MPRVRSVNLGESELNLLSNALTASYERLSEGPLTTGIEDATEVIEALAYALGPGGTPPILLRLQRRDALGHVLAQAELRLDQLDDAPMAFDRLAEALIRRVPIESIQPHRPAGHASRTILGVKLWFAAPLAAGYAFNALGALMFDARFERESYFLEVGVGVVVPGPSGAPNSYGYGGITAELGASKYLTRGDTAIYAGGGLQPRFLFSGDAFDSPLNLAPYGQLGLTLDRSASIRLYADLRLAQNVLPIRVPNASRIPQGAYPTELSGQIGVGW